MIKIDLKLFATLAKHLPEDSECFEVPDNTNVAKLIYDLGIEPGAVKLIFINGKKQDGKYLLKNGDRVGLFPPVGGG
ncbi:MAG: MoaD/ThiS family protein [Desulfobacula sp.]|nr:MoaD/ThiS family protein [Desulfobacula sp.]